MLVRLSAARARYPRGRPATAAVNLELKPPTNGGHALIGQNASGKTRLALALLEPHRYLEQPSLQNATRAAPYAAPCAKTARVSFDAHQRLLAEGGSVYRALGHLGPAARYLVVRFGLHPLLFRPVRSISTGEIRKVLIARALGMRPELLVLDNAFDGLDVPSRDALATIVSHTLAGFKNLLVQGVDASATVHTQVLLLTHRSEEIVDEITTVSSMGAGGELETSERGGRSASAVMAATVGSAAPAMLPTASELAALWPRSPVVAAGASELVRASSLSVFRGEVHVIRNLDWRVHAGEHWVVAGGNGAGKSTLSRLIAEATAQSDAGHASGQLHVLGRDASRVAQSGRMDGVGWVSTELHLREADTEETVASLLGKAAATDALVRAAARWLGVEHLADQPFSLLSQGEQKLVLVGAAIASAPQLLVADEVCQGLDARNRARVLGLLERLAVGGHVSLIYITHHRDEWLDCISHVIQMKDGSAAFIGERAAFETYEGRPA